ncbi:MAG TPA: hypothetical protein VGO63_02770 [Candidatus Paceibacterota bacterium]|jgi:hypothetical protein|nr:hypothetical protein [Candidatus Paceibacterota bacterium]
MSKRNFILLIIILGLVIAGLFGFLYLRSGTTPVDVVTSGTNFLSQFNPFASNTPTPGDEPSGIDTNGDGTITQEELAAVKLKKISSMPIAGFTIFSKERLKDIPVPIAPPSTTVNVTTTEQETVTSVPPATTTTKTTTTTKKVTTKPIAPPTEFAAALRYVERATGNIYQTFADKIIERKFSGIVIPKIYDAYFGNNGQSVVMRHLKPNETTIETFVGALPKEKLGEDMPTNEVKGYFLTDDIKDISLSPDKSKIFYLLSTGGSATGTVLNLADGKKTSVFNSAFTEWNSFWGNNRTITLTTKPSAGVPGYMYTVDIDKKNLIQVLGNVNGLTALMSPNGKLVLVANNNLELYVYHTDTKAYDALGVKTLPEKCTWNKTAEFIYCAVPVSLEGAAYPDDWYRGEISFSDQIWRISLADGNTSMIADPFLIPSGEDIDGIKLELDTNENYLFFVNKKDSYLWELNLK